MNAWMHRLLSKAFNASSSGRWQVVIAACVKLPWFNCGCVAIMMQHWKSHKYEIKLKNKKKETPIFMFSLFNGRTFYELGGQYFKVAIVRPHKEIFSRSMYFRRFFIIQMLWSIQIEPTRFSLYKELTVAAIWELISAFVRLLHFWPSCTAAHWQRKCLILWLSTSVPQVIQR